jgi:hypothetical protein
MNWNSLIRNLYYLIKRLYRGIEFLLRELFKPTSFMKGEDFEKCLRQKVFPQDKYDLVMKTHDFHENSQDYVESSLYPDYLFRDRKKNTEFWVEAKYREKLFEGKVVWCKPFQFKRYQHLDNNLPVIIAIGFGGRPRNPEKIFLVPLEDIKYNALFPRFLQDFEFEGSRKNMIDGVMDKLYNYKK